MTGSDMKSRTNSSEEKEHTYRGYTNEVSHELQELARTFTNQSHHIDAQSSLHTTPGTVPMLLDGSDPRLDPESDGFDAKFWVKNLRKLILSDPDYYKPSDLGVVYKGLRAFGKASDSDYQSNIANSVSRFVSKGFDSLITPKEHELFDILKSMDGIMKPGELTVVLGRPGAGCSTFLKTIAGQTHGFQIDSSSVLSYDGLSPGEIRKNLRGEVVYSAETEAHFAHLTVGETLEFAAKMRAPQNRPEGVSRDLYAKHMTDVVMATYGLSHTKNTRVGNDFVRGVSGGERKRVSIAEVTLSQASL